MPPKVNYSFQKTERDRIKKAKKDAKIREREEAAQTKSAAPAAKTPDSDADRDR